MDKIILNKFSLLYVEDDLETSNLLSKILKKYFKEVFIAYDGFEALSLYKINKPDIVLTDLLMPLLNGIELSKEILNINSKQAIIILSAHNESNYLIDAINLGVSKYIQKPINETKLFTTLIDVCKIINFNNEEEKKEKYIEIQKRILALNNMLKNISHQWRQPLSIISLSASDLKLKNSFNNILSKKDLLTLSTIIEHTHGLSKVLEDFRDITKNSTSEKEKFFVKNILLHCKKLLNNNLIENEINLIIEVDDMLVINQNKNILIQTFLNIINNSINAFIKREIEKKYILIQVKIENNKIIFNIADNAGGIDECILESIFDPYFTTKHQYMGIGLGLSLINEYITNILNGVITIYNKNFNYKNVFGNGVEVSIILDIK